MKDIVTRVFSGMDSFSLNAAKEVVRSVLKKKANKYVLVGGGDREVTIDRTVEAEGDHLRTVFVVNFGKSRMECSKAEATVNAAESVLMTFSKA